MAASYPVRLTGAQLRVLHEALSVVLNDPDWPEVTATSARDFQTLSNAHERIMEAWRAAARAESAPA